MMSKELTNNMEKVIIKTLFESLYKVNKITKKEYKKLLTEIDLILA